MMGKNYLVLSNDTPFKELTFRTAVRQPRSLMGSDGICSERTFNGIIDTGATRCVISHDCVRELGLKPMGIRQRTNRIGGQDVSDTYLVDLCIDEVWLRNVPVTALDLNDGEMLIGMDVIGICNWQMGPTKDGKYKFVMVFPVKK